MSGDGRIGGMAHIGEIMQKVIQETAIKHIQYVAKENGLIVTILKKDEAPIRDRKNFLKLVKNN